MSRTASIGPVAGQIAAEPVTSATALSFLSGSPTYDTAMKRSVNGIDGYGCFRLKAEGRINVPGVIPSTGLGSYVQAYVYFNAFPAAATSRAILNRTEYKVNVDSTGALTLVFNETVIGSASAKLQLGRWYRIGLYSKILTGASENDEAEFRLDGATVATDSGNNRSSAGGTALVLGNSNAGPLDFYICDVVCNSSEGEKETSWPNEEKVIALWPGSDKATTGFKAGGGATTSLWDAVNNAPATGAASTGTNATQIGSANSNTTDNYEANVQSYAEAGLKAGDVIRTVQMFGRFGNSSTTARTIGLSGVSNPEITELTKASGGTAAAAEPTGWQNVSGAGLVAHAPAVTLATSPVVKVKKRTASTDNLMVDQMGLVVSYTPRRRRLRPPC